MFPYGALAGIIIALSNQQAQQVSNRFEKHLERLEFDACINLAEVEHARPSTNWLQKELVLVRKAMALSMLGGHRDALTMLRPLHVDQFPAHEKARYFSVSLISWLLLGRVDAARDIVEVDGAHLRSRHADRRIRERVLVASAAFAAAEGQAEQARRVLERAARRYRCPLHKLLGLTFLARLEGDAGRREEEQALLAEAARLAPRSFVGAMLDEAVRRGWTGQG